MDFIKLMVRQPVTVTVGVILTMIAGILAVRAIPVQLTPNVEDTVISVSTFWEGASPFEVEQEIIDKQEEKLQGITGLRQMTSSSQQATGSIRLEFQVGISKDEALREVSDKLREVSNYPENVDEPIVEASDKMNKDYIAWIVLGTTDPDFDIRTLQDFTEDRVKPAIERMPGVSEVNVLGGREREVQIRFDPARLSQRGVTASQFVAAIRGTNKNISAGQLADGKSDVRVRTLGQYETADQVERTVVANQDGVPVLVRDVADVAITYKEPTSFVRSKGRPVLAINVQRETDSNVMAVMEGVKSAINDMSKPGGLLEVQARKLGVNGGFYLEQVFDQTTYIDEAIELVKSNIWIGGALAIGILTLFLRSVRPVIIIALAIPISVVGAFVVMIALGRSINVISLAGMAFAVGMVVDNAIVVLENTFRHLEMGKKPMAAAYDGAKEVWGAVLASTLTTVAVFIPILLIQEEAGQLFRDIALAICAAVTLSLVVSVTVIPCAAARVLKPRKHHGLLRKLDDTVFAPFASLNNAIGNFIYWACGGWFVRITVVLILTVGSLIGSWFLLPPSDYLPSGNRNLVFGAIIPPPGYNVDQQIDLGKRVEKSLRPYWEAASLPAGSPEAAKAAAALPGIPSNPFAPPGPENPSIIPPPLDNYFFVGFGPTMFHGGVSADGRRVVDMQALFTYATRQQVLPGVLAFARQAPLFRVGGRNSNAVKIDIKGDDLGEVTNSATAVLMQLIQQYGPYSTQPDPSNFNLPGPELQVIPDRVRLADVGMTPAELGLAVQAAGDGAIIGEYRIGGETIDLKVLADTAVDQTSLAGIEDLPIATPSGHVVPLASLAEIRRVPSPVQINRVNRQRAVSLEFTAPEGMPLEVAVAAVDKIVADQRAAGAIPPDIQTSYQGSASKLKAVRAALLGDGTLIGLISSSLFLALLVTYLLMCVLFQSFVRPLVIMFAVPPATFGGFLGLWIIHKVGEANRYVPTQNLDILTMLGVILLIGVVVNNAILIVHQALNFMRGIGESEDDKIEAMSPRRAIAESVRTRVRPIMMSSLTSVLGMLPLVVMPGSGSELYRGLGSVVTGGLLLSTIFTLFLVPLLFSLANDIQAALAKLFAKQPQSLSAGLPAGAVRDHRA
ncbi:MAG: efflux RND transporter permease subunit [Phycisphaerales bacterium]|nr:efflux RND transporter permease subunit [Phycisphaerales bacterium]